MRGLAFSGGRHVRRRTRLRLLVAGSGVASIGDGLVLVGFPLLAVHVTSSALLISGLVVAGQLPWLVVALPGGVLADRVEQGLLVLSVDLLRAVVVAAVALGAATGRITIWEMYAGSFLVGAGETVDFAVSQSLVPLLADETDFNRFNGQVNAAQTAGTQFAGPAVGGFCYSLASAFPFLADAAAYVVAAFLRRAAVPPRPPAGARQAEDRPDSGPAGRLDGQGGVDGAAGAELHGVLDDVRSGLAFLFRSRQLRALTATVASFAFCQAMVMAVLVIYGTHALHLGSLGYGLLLTIAAVGDVGASLLAQAAHGRLGPYWTLVVAGLGAACGYLLLGSTDAVVLAGAALVLEAASTSLGQVASLSLRQRLIPTERFGLVNNAVRMFVTGIIPLGALAGGALTARLGTRATFEVAGSAQLGALALMALPLRAIARSRRRLHAPRKGSQPPPGAASASRSPGSTVACRPLPAGPRDPLVTLEGARGHGSPGEQLLGAPAPGEAHLPRPGGVLDEGVDRLGEVGGEALR